MSDHTRHFIRWASHNVLACVLIVIAMLSTFSWLTQSQEVRREAADSASATKYAKVGRWTWTVGDHDKPGTLRWDDAMMEIYGTTRDEWSKKEGYHAWFDRVHPEDQEFVQSRIELSVKNKGGYSAVFRVIGDNGETRYILASGTITADGRHMTGICLELTGDRFKDLYRVLPPIAMP